MCNVTKQEKEKGKISIGKAHKKGIVVRKIKESDEAITTNYDVIENKIFEINK